MKHCAALACTLLLASACPAGPDTASDGGTGTIGASSSSTATTTATDGSATAATTTTTTTTTTGTGTTPPTGGATEASTGETGGTTLESTGGATAESTGGTTGGQTCDAIVGSDDCAALAGVSPDLTLEDCMTCQGAPCGQEAMCDQQFPCVDGSIVLRGCCTDAQCTGLTMFCGMFIGVNHICVNDDDV